MESTRDHRRTFRSDTGAKAVELDATNRAGVGGGDRGPNTSCEPRSRNCYSVLEPLVAAGALGLQAGKGRDAA